MSMRSIIKLAGLLLGTLVLALGILVLASAQTATESVAARAPAPITQLTDDSKSDLDARWSPDDSLIAFDSNREGIFHIYVMDTNGNHLRALTTGTNEDRHPVWTPDGKSILYDSFDGIHRDIWSVNLVSGNRKQLTRVDGLADLAALSPDGQTIAFYVYKDMTLNLWSARADGSDAKPLTLDLADARREEPTVAWHEPAWSRDSEWLAFTGGDGKSIWIMRRDGSESRAIISDGETNHFPWFLADGRLAFITEYVPPKYGGAWTNAYAYDLKTGERTLLQQFMSMQGPVDWNADNSKLVFSSPRSGNFDIFLIDLNVDGGLAALRGPRAMATLAEEK